mgnify:CR=1 FL=1
MISVLTLQPLDKIAIVGRPTGSGMPEEQRAALSRVLRAIKLRDFADVSVTKMAEAWRLDQSYFNQVYNGLGAGMSFLMRLREASGLSLDTLLGLELKPVHLVEDEKVRQEVAKLPAGEPADNIAQALERLDPLSAPTKREGPETPKPRTRAKLPSA